MGTNIKSRVDHFCRYKGISVRNFCSRIGAANGYFKESLQSISLEYRAGISREFPELSLSWLVLGEGAMLNESSMVNEVVPKYYTSHTPVRVVTTTARAGYSDSYYADEYLKDMPVIMIESDREYKGKYLAFEVDGDSMEPEYNKGDIVICREIQRDHWKTKLHFQDWDFVIAHGTRGIMLKEITAHNVETGEITCHSINSDTHPDFTLNLGEVAYLYNIVEHRRIGKNTRRRRQL